MFGDMEQAEGQTPAYSQHALQTDQAEKDANNIAQSQPRETVFHRANQS